MEKPVAPSSLQSGKRFSFITLLVCFAGYTLGYVLECALKAAICKRLELQEYPADDGNLKAEVKEPFNSHSFDVLATLAGLSKLTSAASPDLVFFQSWSEATEDYLSAGGGGKWISLRYKVGFWDQNKVKKVYRALADQQTGILRYLRVHKRW